MSSYITSTAAYLPDNIVSNADLTQFPKNGIPLIEAKTGVKTRRHAPEGMCTSDLAIQAGKACLEQAGFDPRQLEAIILSTSSPDRIQPATATRVQDGLDARRAFAFDVNAVCSGGIYALHLADCMIRAGECRHVLVIAAEMYSRILNPRDFTTYPYFGDGAGAMLVSGEGGGNLIKKTILHTDGAGHDVIQVPGGGTMLPAYRVTNAGDHYFKMQGRQVFDFAVQRGTEVVRELLSLSGLALSQVRYIIAHQANINILRGIADQLGCAEESFWVNLDRYGNTASASVIIALDEVMKSVQLDRGDHLVMVTFGGGLSWGATLIQV